MVKKSKTVAAEPEIETADYSGYRDKPATDLQERMAEWVLEKVDPIAHEDGDEVDLDEPSFREGVRLGVALRMQFQASPENQAVLEANRLAREEEAAAPAKPVKKKAAKAKVEPEPDEEDEDDTEEDEPEEEPTPAPKAKRKAGAAAKTATAKAPDVKPAARRTARARVAAKVKGDNTAEVGSDAPF
jgi:hypothetical protein